jgi:hypothetical protein
MTYGWVDYDNNSITLVKQVCPTGCGASAVAGKIADIPLVPGGGILLGELFIKSERAGPFRGDARDFDSAPNPQQSRAFFMLNFEKGTGTFQINPTCLAGLQICRSALPVGQGNSVKSSVNGNTVNIRTELRNSFLSWVPKAIDIDVSINISVTARPNGAPIISGSRDPFPSFELTTTVGGTTRFLVQQPESRFGFICLTGICGRDTFDSR